MSKSVLLLTLAAVIALASCMYTRSIPEPQTFYDVQMHPNCIDRDYCLEMSDLYPSELISYLLTKFNSSITNIEVIPEDRGAENHHEVKPCESYSTLDPIYQIKDTENKVRYVVQSKDKFEQIIRLEMCKTALPSNTDPFAGMSRDYVAYCNQTYTDYRFLVLTFDGRGFESVKARPKSIPVCCRCEIKVNIDESKSTSQQAD